MAEGKIYISLLMYFLAVFAILGLVGFIAQWRKPANVEATLTRKREQIGSD